MCRADVRAIRPAPYVKVPGHGWLLVAGPFAHGNLSVFILHSSHRAPETDYITLEEGIGAGLVKITEAEREQVTKLLITNKSTKPLFLLAGELVKGGKQDRTLRTSLVIPPKTVEAPIPSLCIEQSRWSGGKAFVGQGAILSNAGQAAVVTGDQGNVWRSVLRYKRSLRANAAEAAGRAVAPSRTSSMLEELDAKEVKDLTAGYRKALGGVGLRLRRPLGLAYAADGKMTALHVFDSSSLFRKLRGKILDSAITDAASGQIRKRPANVTIRDLKDFIAAAWDGKKTTQRPGYGNVVVRYLAEKTFTSQLFYRKDLVHSQVGRIERRAVRPTRRIIQEDNAPQQNRR